MAFHHGISKKEPVSGIIPMRDAQTNVIALLAFSNDADPLIFPLDTPVLITSINKGLAGSGTQGNLRSSLEAIAAITNPTLIVVRISDPFANNNFDASTVIGTTLSTGQRTGLQAFLTAKSILGLTPKILIAPDVESPAVVQTLASLCKKLRAYSYITPRDEFGIMLETEQQVVACRDTLGFREIEIVWPEWTSDNVFLGAESTEISCVGAINTAVISNIVNGMFDIQINEAVFNNIVVQDQFSLFWNEYFASNLNTLAYTVYSDSSSNHYFVNNSENPIRIRIKNHAGISMSAASNNQNTTVHSDENTITFCLAPAGT